ncbi:MAG TPA: nuclear transport factor 2 family protein [Ilumatobacter sp.]|nr:nuclear transport factor 2 family protein [Ilumatobacter sp.]
MSSSATSATPDPPVIEQTPRVPLSTTDRLALHELAHRYGNAVDARDWEALAAVFTPNARFVVGADDPSPIVHVGIDAITEMMRVGPHPVTHHVTNVVVDDSGDEVRLFFKVLGTGPRGRVGSADYHDTVQRSTDGWRIHEHLVTFRRAERSDESSTRIE